MPIRIGRPYATDQARHRVLIAALVAVTLIFAGLTCEGLWSARREAYRDAITSSRNLLQVAVMDIDRTLRSYDASLLAATEALAMPSFDTLGAAVQRQMLFDGSANEEQFGSILIADEQGDIGFQSRLNRGRINNVADRDYFTVHRDGLHDGLYVSAPFKTQGDNVLAIAISRRIDKRDGSFGGTVSGVVHLSYFRELLSQADLGRAGSMTVLLNGAIVIAREPSIEGTVGTDISRAAAVQPMRAAERGTFVATAELDHVRRLYTFARVGGFPLTVSVNRSVEAIYANWRANAVLLGSSTFLTMVILLWLAFELHGELRRRREAERLARETAGLFEVIATHISDVILRIAIDGTRLYVSPSAERFLGYKPDELIGRPWMIVIHPEDHWIMNDAMRRLHEDGDEVGAAYRCVHKRGSDVFVETRMRLVRDVHTGEPREIIAISRDSTWQHKVEEELLRQAATDGLTGMSNRRAFDEALEKEWRRAMRICGPVSLLMLDADTFKKYNDRYGHLEGDSVLRSIADSIVQSIGRPGDLGARYGGEEFVVLLPGTDRTGALVVAEAIRSAVEARGIPHELSQLGLVTVSIGVACAIVQLDQEPSDLIEEADAALYAAKRRGRNCVAVVQKLDVGMEAAD